MKPKFKKTTGDRSDIHLSKMPPQAIELEKAILGAILLEKSIITDVALMLKPEHFYSTSHQIIFNAMLILETSVIGIDILTLSNKLRELGKLEEIGGDYYLVTLTNNVVSTAHIQSHIKIIIQKYIGRSLIEGAGEILTGAYDETNDVFSSLEKASDLLYKIKFDIENTKSSSLESIALNYIKEREVLKYDENRLFTGLKEWDKINGSLFKGGIYVIAGRPAMGKTAYCIELLKNISQKVHCGFINLEMTESQIVQRLISNMKNIDNYEFKKQANETPEWLNNRIYEGMQDFINLKLHIESKPGQTIEQIVSKLKYWKYKYDIQIGVIDFLQIIASSPERDKYSSDLQVMNYNLDRLSYAAKELNIPIILLSQLNRELYKRGSKEPEMSDLKGSGKIEEIAYQISFLHRPEYYGIMEDETGESTTGLCYQIIKKHRDGLLGKIKYRFEGQFSRFSEWDELKFNAPNSFMPYKNDNDSEIGF